MHWLLIVPGLLLGVSCAAAEPGKLDLSKLPAPAAGVVDFARDIQPLFAKHCHDCHGAEKQRGGVRLDDGKAALTGGNAGAVIVPGKGAASRLLHVVAGADADLIMPPKGRAPLSKAEVAKLRAWIDQGAKWPAPASAAGPTNQSDHWAFRPIPANAPPPIHDASWVRNGIDRFILVRLEQEKIAPAPPADAVTMIRRLSFDLIGLPPTLAEVDEFLRDCLAEGGPPRPVLSAEYSALSTGSPVHVTERAYRKLVDRLLASPHYGERWGRHWLDLARYADSDGYEADRPRPYHWRYRDWVIGAFNADMPFDRFTIEQLAGDLLPGATLAQRTATGFHRNTLTNREGGTDKEQFRVEACVDRVATTAKVWLGLTLGCAQCHDHKYDPLSQREFYQFFAFFNGDDEVDVAAPLPEDVAAKTAFEKRKAELEAKVTDRLGKDDAAYTKLTQALADHVKKPPTPAYVPTLGVSKGRKTHVLIRGDFLRPGVAVEAGTPGVLPALTSGRTRLDLARWLVAREQPLTPRVIANWVWHHYFGRGLVATLEDFGTQGEKPSHPELLDHLGRKLIELNWSMKELHRHIVTSATYRQSSKARPELASRDPSNVLLARQNRIRLEGEILRDNALAVSGLLVRKVGGPSVKPPQPAGISELTYAGSAKWVESRGEDRYRRGLYTWFQRTSPYPLLTMFDAPDANLSCVRRDRTNTPLQALTNLNDPTFVECAQALAQRVVAEKSGSPSQRLDHAFRLSVGRHPTALEQESLQKMYDEVLALAQANPKEAARLAQTNVPGATGAESATWVAIARMLMNLDEFVTRE